MTETRVRVRSTLGVSDHNLLENRYMDDQHTINSVAGLGDALDAKADKTEIPSNTSDLTNDSGFITEEAIAGKQDALSVEQMAAVNSGITSSLVSDFEAKQNAIPDLDTIRSGAALGTTSVQSVNNISPDNSGNVNLDDRTFVEFPNSWTTDGTIAELMTDITNDTSAEEGMAYLGEVTCSDLPFNGNADMKIYIIDGSNGAQGKVITGVITSGTTAPYYWQMTYWNGHSSGWQSFIPTNKVDNSPISASTNVITSGGVYTALAAKADTSSLANVATSGSYNDLSNTPTIGNATLTIQKNSENVDTFTSNATVDKIINILVPTSAADVSALPASTKYAANVSVTIDSSTYVVTAQLKDQDGNNLGSAQTIDLPLESVVVSGSYDSTNEKIVLTLQSGSTIDIPVGALISGLQSEITVSNKLDADLVDDSTSTHKFVTATDKTTWDGKQDAISDLGTIRTNATNGASAYTTIGGYGDVVTHDASEFATSTQGGKADTALQSGDNVSELVNDAGYAVASSLATVATSGDYTDLINKPSIPAAQVNADWNASSGIAQILNKPSIPAAQVNSDWSAVSGVAQILNKPSLATVATSGSYNDLSDKPSIPAAQVNSDWSAVSGVSQILNKPNIPTVYNSTIVITQGGVNKGSFNLNQSSGDTIALDSGVEIDDSTITENAQNKLQTVAVINQNTANGATNPLKIWEGTSAEYNSGGSQTWYNWKYETAGSLGTWTNVSITDTNYKGIVYAFDKFFIVGEGNVIKSSTDGTSWTTVTSINESLLGIAFGNNILVAVGEDPNAYNKGVIYTSTDGETWTKNTSLSSFSPLQCVTYGDKFVALGLGCYYSTDGLTWVSGTKPSTYSSVTYGNGKYIAVGNKVIASSTDGTSFTAMTAPTVNLFGIKYLNNMFIAVGTNTVMYSTDGATFTSVNVSSGTYYDVAYGCGMFVAVGWSGAAISSTNGTTWSSITLPNTNTHYAITFANNTFVAVGSGALYNVCTSGASSNCYTTTPTPTTSDTVYSAPSTASALTITSVGTGTITLSDTNTYDYNSAGNQTTVQTVGEAHPDWICMIEGVGVKKGATLISTANTVDQTYNALSTNAQSGVAVASGISDTLGTIETALQGV